MLIRVGYDIRFDLDVPIPMVAMLNVHPSRRQDRQEPDAVTLHPAVARDEYVDSFGNLCTRFVAPPGTVALTSSSPIRDSGEPDQVDPSAAQIPVGELPPEVLRFLMASRYCEVDLLSHTATDLFGTIPPGWARVQAVCDWVHQKVTFSYPHARPTRTALDVFAERVGVCRDFQHLAITLCRCLNIPARSASFGAARLSHFTVVTDEVGAA